MGSFLAVSELRPQKTPISVTPQKLGYNHPLNTQQFKDIQDKIRKHMLAGNVQSLKRLTNDIVQRKRCKSDIKVFVLCYSVMEMTKVGSRYEEAKYALRRAKSMIGDCKNHQVLSVRIKRLHLQISRMTNSLDSCGKQIYKIEMSVDNCAPSPDTCAFYCEKAYILDRTCRRDTEYIIEQLFETAIKHCLSKSCKDNSDILACYIYIRKAMFHLKSYHRRYHEIELTEEEIHNAQEAMQAIPYDALTIARVYHYEYYLAKSQLEFHKHHILDAVSSARSALKICKELKCEDWLYVEEWIKSIQKTSGSETGTCHSTTYISSWQCLLYMCVLILSLFFVLVLTCTSAL